MRCLKQLWCSCNAGLEQGAIMHVPSTKDLLAQVPVDKLVDAQAWRQRAALGGRRLARWRWAWSG